MDEPVNLVLGGAKRMTKLECGSMWRVPPLQGTIPCLQKEIIWETLSWKWDGESVARVSELKICICITVVASRSKTGSWFSTMPNITSNNCWTHHLRLTLPLADTRERQCRLVDEIGHQVHENRCDFDNNGMIFTQIVPSRVGWKDNYRIRDDEWATELPTYTTAGLSALQAFALYWLFGVQTDIQLKRNGSSSRLRFDWTCNDTYSENASS